MRIVSLILFTAVFGSLWAAGGEKDALQQEILAIERKALDGWQAGNPDPLLATCDPEITYFHAVTDKRADGLPALKALFEPYRGKPLFDRYEITDPKVQASGDTAVLTYILVQHNGADARRWNATQVYQRKKEGWLVIHSHWSVTRGL